MKVRKCVRTTNLIRDKELSDRKRSLSRRITPPLTERTFVFNGKERNSVADDCLKHHTLHGAVQ